MEYIHNSVLLNETIAGLNIKSNGVYVDATLGGGGHSLVIANKLINGKLICIDQDDYAIEKAKIKLNKFNKFNNIIYLKGNFSNLKNLLADIGINKIDGIVYDLGVSSFQFDIPERGFSYNNDSKLDMRMDKKNELSAWNIVNEFSFNQIVNILYRYSDEKNAKRIVREIENNRKNKSIDTTFELVDIIKSSLPQAVLKKKGHPAKRTFQALRIAVNDELKVFETSLLQAIELLKNDGRVCVISFHSLEDRICKNIFKSNAKQDIPKNIPIKGELLGILELITNKPITASEEELLNNNRAHSAKLRIARKR